MTDKEAIVELVKIINKVNDNCKSYKDAIIKLQLEVVELQSKVWSLEYSADLEATLRMERSEYD